MVTDRIPLYVCDHEASEIEDLEGRINGWQVRFVRLGPGECPGRVQERQLPSLLVVRLLPGGPVAVSSQPRGAPDPFQVGILSPAPAHPVAGLVWDGTPVDPAKLLVKDGTDGSRFVLPAGAELLVARFDRKRLAMLAPVLNLEAGMRARRLELYRAPTPELEELRTRLRALLPITAAGQPHLVEMAEQDVYERVARILGGRRDPTRLPSGERGRVLMAAEKHVRENARERITLADLCLAARCSERTLRYAFHAHYGISPACFVKRVRLQGLRRSLLEARPDAKVIDLAFEWGFWHLGHLSYDYKQLFDERPVDTLARTRDSAARPVRGERSTVVD